VLTVVTFKWNTPGYRSYFGPKTVNVLRSMVRRNYPHGHEFVCVTDDRTGIDADIRIVPLWSDLRELKSPHGGHNPACYPRLKLFSEEAVTLIGHRFVCLDLDTVITGDLSALWNRPEDFIAWKEQDVRSFFNCSMFMMTAGARPQVWNTFDPKTSPAAAKAAGRFGSDQGWISHCLGPNEAKWTQADGVYSYRVDIQKNRNVLPSNAKVVMFHGGTDPWVRNAQQIDWIRRCYR
jgi:hypothetical protein